MPNFGEIPTFDKSDRLAKALQHAHVSVQEMADEIGVSRNTIGNYINRRTPIPRAAVTVWALRTGVPREWLESGQGPADGHDGPPEGSQKTHEYLHPCAGKTEDLEPVIHFPVGAPIAFPSQIAGGDDEELIAA